MRPPTASHVLLVSCPDQPGLVHAITGILFHHGLNIVENHEYVDREGQSFFMRTEIAGGVASDRLVEELRSTLPHGSRITMRAREPRRLVVLATREPHCLGDLLLRHDAGELNASIVAVLSQYGDLETLTSRFGIPFHCVPVAELTRERHEDALDRVIQDYRPDLLVLAKYMRVLTSGFVARYPGRILNIHHSFLPAFIGKNPYAQAYARGVKIIGATAHFVNEQLDEGPIITQSVIPINHAQDAADLARSGRDVERIVLARALKLVLEDRVVLHGQRTLVFE